MSLRFSRRASLQSLAAIAASQMAGSAATGGKAPPIRFVILDVGGTIIEDRGDVPVALRTAFSRQGIEVTPAEITIWRGASKREIVRHFVELRAKAQGADQTKLIDTIYKDFNAQIDEAYRTAKGIPGAEKAFEEMRSAGLTLATTSGFDLQLTDAMFRRLGWQKYFAASISGEDVAMGRPAPFMLFHAMEAARISNVAEVVAVGDTPLDLQAGTNSGVRGVVGVLTGASTPELLRKESHTHILDSVAGLPKLLATEFR